MGLDYKPDFYITANNQDITDAIKDSLINLSLTDNSGEDIDRLSISLLLPEHIQTPTKGAELGLGLGFSGGIAFKGKFIVDEVSTVAPPRVVSIIANAAPLANKATMQTQKTKSFDDMTFTDLVDEISSKHQLKPAVSEGVGILKLDHIDQTNESDMSLLSRLAKKNDAVVQVKNNSLILMKKDEAKSVSGKPLKRIKITHDQVSSWQCTTSSRGDVKKVTARYFDVADGIEKEVSIGTGEPVISMPIRYSSKHEAEQAVKARINGGKSGSSTIAITMPVTAEFLDLVAEGEIELNGFGDIEDRVWTVRSLEWSLSKSGFTLRVNADIGAKPKAEQKAII